MDQQIFFELLGYLASVLVAVSLMMKAIVRLRVINLLGALAFSVYGFLIGSWPVAAMNAFIVGINLYYLFRLRAAREAFTLLETRAEEPVFRYFLDFYGADIRLNQPGFDGTVPAGSRTLLVMRDAVPAGILVGRVDAAVFEILLDYVPPQFRDFKIGRFLFETNRAWFLEQGCTVLQTPAGLGEHARYLEKIGFTRKPDGTAFFLLNRAD